jgi:uncharacterized protein (DUF433 family)
VAAKLGHGVYSFGEAARLTGLRGSRVREWFRGRADKSFRKVFRGDYQPIDGDFAISFLDLIDVFVAGRLREHGVTLQTLRRVITRMAEDFKTTHPFSRQELLSDGKMVFLRNLDSIGQNELTEVLTRQKVFPNILLPFLQRIDYDEVTILARRWRIANMVVIDPGLSFGKPVVETVAIPTKILAASYYANCKNADRVADWYGIHPSHVLAAVRFENEIAA